MAEWKYLVTFRTQQSSILTATIVNSENSKRPCKQKADLSEQSLRIGFSLYLLTGFKYNEKGSHKWDPVVVEMVPARGIEPRAHPYHGRVLPLYYAGA